MHLDPLQYLNLLAYELKELVISIMVGHFKVTPHGYTVLDS